MAVSPGFRAYVLDQLQQVSVVTTRPMFGGLTFFHEGRAFALIAQDRLYFKVDDSNREDFLAQGMGPFLPFGDPEKPMAYFEVPESVLEDLDELRPWVHKAQTVAARHAKPRRRKEKP
ncbi:MAG: TfoX/Sxy family protein [Firmicutes bacterium]|nr:TfoX/Sxy family protein [Bacillota bacterium]